MFSYLNYFTDILACNFEFLKLIFHTVPSDLSEKHFDYVTMLCIYIYICPSVHPSIFNSPCTEQGQNYSGWCTSLDYDPWSSLLISLIFYSHSRLSESLTKTQHLSCPLHSAHCQNTLCIFRTVYLLCSFSWNAPRHTHTPFYVCLT